MAVEASGREGALRALAPPARTLALPATIVFGIAGIALLALGIARAPDRRRGIWAGGITVAAAAGLLAAGEAVASGGEVCGVEFPPLDPHAASTKPAITAPAALATRVRTSPP